MLGCGGKEGGGRKREKDEGKVNKSRRIEHKSCIDYREEDADFASVDMNSYFILI